MPFHQSSLSLPNPVQATRRVVVPDEHGIDREHRVSLGTANHLRAIIEAGDDGSSRQLQGSAIQGYGAYSGQSSIASLQMPAGNVSNIPALPQIAQQAAAQPVAIIQK